MLSTYASYSQSSASAVTPENVFNPVYAPAIVMADGTAIPQYVRPVAGVEVLVLLSTSSSTSAGVATVVVGRDSASGLLNEREEVDEKRWFEVKMVEVALSEQSPEVLMNPGHMAEPSTVWSIPVLPMLIIVVVVDSVPLLLSGASDP